jgi:hypothetical protein
LLLTPGAAAARVVDEFARLAEAYQAGAQHTRFPCIDKTDDRNVIGSNRPAVLAPARRRCAIVGGLRCCCSAAFAAPRRGSPARRTGRDQNPFVSKSQPAGGSIDSVPRTLSNSLAASFGVPVVVENRPGAGGNVAAAVVARAEPRSRT